MPVTARGHVSHARVKKFVRDFIANSRTKSGNKLANLAMFINFVNSPQGNRGVHILYPQFYQVFKNTRSAQGTNIKNYVRNPSSTLINQALVNRWNAAVRANERRTPNRRPSSLNELRAMRLRVFNSSSHARRPSLSAANTRSAKRARTTPKPKHRGFLSERRFRAMKRFGII